MRLESTTRNLSRQLQAATHHREMADLAESDDESNVREAFHEKEHSQRPRSIPHRNVDARRKRGRTHIQARRARTVRLSTTSSALKRSSRRITSFVTFTLP